MARCVRGGDAGGQGRWLATWRSSDKDHPPIPYGNNVFLPASLAQAYIICAMRNILTKNLSEGLCASRNVGRRIGK